MSTGTNKERITENNGIISENNADLTALKTRINNLPTSGDTTATANDILQGKTAVSKGVKLTGTLQPGIDTSDATATAGDMASGVTAYVNGEKITGNVSVVNNGGAVNASGTDILGNNVIFVAYNDVLIREGGGLSRTKSQLANRIGLTADKLKKDEVVLGVTGTYEGTKVVLPDGIKFEGSSATNMDWLSNADTSNIVNGALMFKNMQNLRSVPQFDSSNMTNINQMFSGCLLITLVPQLDTSNATMMINTFSVCRALTTIPILDTSKVSSMQYAFHSCDSLSNESLNNILAMCANTTSAYTATKTLQYIGLSQTQAETCQTLSNWDAFVAAGWSSGY